MLWKFLIFCTIISWLTEGIEQDEKLYRDQQQYDEIKRRVKSRMGGE